MPNRSVQFVILDFHPDPRTIGHLGPRAMHSAPQLALALRMGGAPCEAGTKLVCQLAHRLYMQFNHSVTIKRWGALLLAKFGHYQSGLHFVR